MYTSGEASKVTAVPYRTIDHWSRTGLLRATVEARGSGKDRRYSFRELVILRVMREFRDAGVSTRILPVVIKHLRLKDRLEGWLIVANGQAYTYPEICRLLETEGMLVYVVDLTRVVTETRDALALTLNEMSDRRIDPIGELFAIAFLANPVKDDGV